MTAACRLRAYETDLRIMERDLRIGEALRCPLGRAYRSRQWPALAAIGEWLAELLWPRLHQPGDRECLGEGILFPSEHASLLPDRLNRLDLLSTRAASSSADVTRRARPEQRRRCSGWQGRRVRLR